MLNKMHILLIFLMLVFLVTGCGTDQGVDQVVTNSVDEKTEDKVYSWRFQAMHPEGTGSYQRIVEHCESIGKLTGGRLEITPFPAGSLVGSYELPQAISDGVIDSGIIASAYLAGTDLGFMLFSYIPAGMSYEEIRLWFHMGGGLELLREAHEPLNIYIAQPFFGTEEPIMSTKPIRSVKDFEGLSIRIPGLGASLANELGMTVVDVPIEEHYTSLATGVIDIIDPAGAFGVVYSMALHEVAPYAILPGWHQPYVQVEYAINLDRWNELPEDLQAILQSELMGLSYYDYMATMIEEANAVENMKEEGVEFIMLPEGDLEKITALAEKLYEEQWSKMSPLAEKIAESMAEFRSSFELYDSLRTY